MVTKNKSYIFASLLGNKAVKFNPKVVEMVDVVQLVRASVCGSECRGFESHLPPLINKIKGLQEIASFFYVFKLRDSILYFSIKATFTPIATNSPPSVLEKMF